MSERGLAHVLIIAVSAIVLLLILGLVYYFMVFKNIFSPPKQAEYQNPFQKTSQYENPFSEYQNPFDDLE